MNTLTEQSVTPSNSSIPYGICLCGCGGKTAISKKTRKKWGYVKGVPRKWIKGHFVKPYGVTDDRIPFKIEDDYCTFIPLTQGYIAIIDIDDYPRFTRRKYQALDIDGRIVAARTIKINGKYTSVYLHQEILPEKDGYVTDHKNRIPLDNRKKNLRYATSGQNSFNIGVTKRNTSGYKGVSYHAKGKKWRAVIRYEGRLIHLGLFSKKEDAAHAYDRAALLYFGEFAYFNFPEEMKSS